MAADVHDLGNYRAKLADRPRPPSLKDGDGGGTFDDMEPRVAALEKTTDRIERKIDALTDAVQKVAVDVAGIKEKANALATTASVTEVATALKDKPGTWQVVLISLLMAGLTVAAALGGAAKLIKP